MKPNYTPLKFEQTTPCPYTSAALLVTVGNARGEVSQVNEARSPSVHAAVAVQGAYPGGPAAKHDAETVFVLGLYPVAHATAHDATLKSHCNSNRQLHSRTHLQPNWLQTAAGTEKDSK